MALETAASMTAPEGAIWQAWVDAALHPKFATFQRWFPKMNSRWCGISLVTSVLLIIMTSIVYLAIHAFVAPRSTEALSLIAYYAYLRSSEGIRRAVINMASSVALIFAIPAFVTLISPRGLGPYRIRFKRVYRPWMQVQPAICVLLLASALVNFVTGFVQLSSDISALVAFVLFAWPALRSWQLTYEALAAGSSRNIYLAGCVAAIPGLLWLFLPTMLGQQ